VTGWATARFGLFGAKAEEPSLIAINYVGVVLTVFSAFFYAFVKSETKEPKVKPVGISAATSTTEILNDEDEILPQEQTGSVENSSTENEQNKEFFDKLNPLTKKILGISLAIFAGIMYGQSFTPILYLRNNYENTSSNYLDYLYSFYTGIILTSILYFSIYCAAKKNRPKVNPEVILPGLISGIYNNNYCFF
jgi:hypothetical protein